MERKAEKIIYLKQNYCESYLNKPLFDLSFTMFYLFSDSFRRISRATKSNTLVFWALTNAHFISFRRSGRLAYR